MKRWLIGLVVALTLLRLLAAEPTELLPEEAYYWTYAKHPALGYFDHPPMVAWCVRLGTLLLGDTERGVRLVNMLLWVVSCGLLWLTGRMWFGERVASGAALLFTALPIFVGIGFIVTPDGPLLFFWLLTLYSVSKALRTERSAYWLLAGVGVGGALLSKYYALLLVPSLLLFLVRSPTHRRWLVRPQPWLALVVALVVFSPVIVWNAQHQWASFAFQSTRTVGNKGSAVVQVGLFWLVQLAILTPPLFVLLAVAAGRAVKRGWLQREDNWNFVAAFSLPLFVLFALASFKAEIHVNWTAPAFLSLTLGGAAVWLPEAQRWRVAGWVAGGICAVVIVLGHTSLGLGKPKIFAYSRAGGWRELAAQVDTAKAELSQRTGHQPFVLGADKYNIAAELGFYLHEPEECVNLFAVGSHGLGYRFWADLRQFEGRPAVAVLLKRREDTLEELRAHFDRLDALQPLHVGKHGRRWREVYLVNCYGYHIEHRPLTAGTSGL